MTELKKGDRVRITQSDTKQGEIGVLIEIDEWVDDPFPYLVQLDSGGKVWVHHNSLEAVEDRSSRFVWDANDKHNQPKIFDTWDELVAYRDKSQREHNARRKAMGMKPLFPNVEED